MPREIFREEPQTRIIGLDQQAPAFILPLKHLKYDCLGSEVLLESDQLPQLRMQMLLRNYTSLDKNRNREWHFEVQADSEHMNTHDLIDANKKIIPEAWIKLVNIELTIESSDMTFTAQPNFRLLGQEVLIFNRFSTPQDPSVSFEHLIKPNDRKELQSTIVTFHYNKENEGKFPRNPYPRQKGWDPEEMIKQYAGQETDHLDIDQYRKNVLLSPARRDLLLNGPLNIIS